MKLFNTIRIQPITTAPVLALLVLLVYTNPGTLPLPLLLLPFMLLFWVFFLGFRWITSRVFNFRHINRGVVASFLALFPVIVLLLSSSGQLSGSDIFVVLVLLGGVVLYLRYADFL